MVKILDKILYLNEEGENKDNNIYYNNIIRDEVRILEIQVEEIISDKYDVIIPLHGFVLVHDKKLSVKNFMIDKDGVVANSEIKEKIIEIFDNYTGFATYDV